MGRLKKYEIYIYLFILSFLNLFTFCSNGDKKNMIADRKFYNSITRYEFDMNSIEKELKNGANANKCYGECGWIDSNPLLYLTQGTYTTYYRQKRNEAIPNPTPDIQLMNLLVSSGANINLYPYVWIMVYRNNDIENKENEDKSYIKDCNRTLKGFLDNGADVNAKGNHITIDWQTYKSDLSYEEFCRLCSTPEATTPIYEAVKKGMLWESQVDLLLEYGARLDESCLEAAKLSGDEEMVQKVEKLLQY